MAEGWQVELPEDWLAHGNPWEFERRESAYEVGFISQAHEQSQLDATVNLIDRALS